MYEINDEKKKYNRIVENFEYRKNFDHSIVLWMSSKNTQIYKFQSHLHKMYIRFEVFHLIRC